MAIRRFATCGIEGSIGVGKSRFAKEVGEALRALGYDPLVQMEPDEKSNPYLKDFYKDPAKYGTLMQFYLLGRRFLMENKGQWWAMGGHGPAIWDRTLSGDTCFARMLNQPDPDNGGAIYIDERDFDNYGTIYQEMTSFVLQPTIIIHLMADVEVVHERIQRRAEERAGRKCEEVITRGYLERLDAEITNMVQRKRESGVTVWDVPWEADLRTPEARADIVRTMAKRIGKFEPKEPLLDTMYRRIIR